MSPQDPQAAALLAHVVSQIEQNVNFLASQNYLSQSDAATILTKLPNLTNNVAKGDRVCNMNLSTARAVPPPSRHKTECPEQHGSSLPRAQAIWSFNGVRHEFVPFSPRLQLFVSRSMMTCNSTQAILSRSST